MQISHKLIDSAKFEIISVPSILEKYQNRAYSSANRIFPDYLIETYFYTVSIHQKIIRLIRIPSNNRLRRFGHNSHIHFRCTSIAIPSAKCFHILYKLLSHFCHQIGSFRSLPIFHRCRVRNVKSHLIRINRHYIFATGTQNTRICTRPLYFWENTRATCFPQFILYFLP